MIDGLGSVLTTAVSGMEASTRALQQVAHRVANPDRSLQTVERDTVELAVASVTYKANVAVVRTADEMLGTLIDVRA